MSEFPPPALRQAAEDVASLLRERKETISVAETAAGGLVSAALLSTPGASRIYKGGLTLYTLDSRIAFAGWTQANIDNYDGPTPKLVEGLASHVRVTLKSNYTVGEVRLFPHAFVHFVSNPAPVLSTSLLALFQTQVQSGTAGPTASGKAKNRQPGYVALAVVGEKGALSKDLDTGLGSDRQANMVAFAIEALKLVKEYISTNESQGGKI
ncbi:hypothetical protein EDD37DRAFT_646267 [Exophiala viscosa]|uniref:uncharacterized protein n=1 Tax=Exophiala viscosa TaxID=2486360 RepID=UPI00219A6FBD|nr:hypothetical protein EDD37DRAFT_646267 [Exophiala viscosa]